MSKKNGGLFGSLFDFNGDGKTDIGKEFIAYKIFEECLNDDDDTDDDFFPDDDLDLDSTMSMDSSWRYYCEDGTDFGIFPEDYESEEDYEKALNDAKYAWRNTCEDGSDFGIFPEDYETEEEYTEALDDEKSEYRNAGVNSDNDNIEEEEYSQARAVSGKITFSLSLECPALDKLDAIKESEFPNKRRYNAAYTLANEFICYPDKEAEKKEKECCRFIIENADNILAADYLSYDSGFLYSQAIKDNFVLPVSLPDEDETKEFGFFQILCKIAKKDIDLSFEIWSWTLEQFLPYTQYDDSALTALTSDVISELYGFPDNYTVELVRYMENHPDFRQKIASGGCGDTDDYANLMVTAIKNNLGTTAVEIFKACLELSQGQWKTIKNLTDSAISWCRDFREVESIEFFRDNLFPLVKGIEIGMIQDEIDNWEKEISDYIDETEQESDKYTYSRRYAWRKEVPDGKKYGLKSTDCETEQEYLEAYRERKYAWRELYTDEDTLDLNIEDFETQKDFLKAFNAKMSEKRKKDHKENKTEHTQQRKKSAVNNENIDDKTIYTVCGVIFAHAARPYNYKTDDATIKMGDKVIVPAGNSETVGTVVSVGQFLRIAAPFPIDKMKSIIRKIEDDSDNK